MSPTGQSNSPTEVNHLVTSGNSSPVTETEAVSNSVTTEEVNLATPHVYGTPYVDVQPYEPPERTTVSQNLNFEGQSETEEEEPEDNLNKLVNLLLNKSNKDKIMVKKTPTMPDRFDGNPAVFQAWRLRVETAAHETNTFTILEGKEKKAYITNPRAIKCFEEREKTLQGILVGGLQNNLVTRFSSEIRDTNPRVLWQAILSQFEVSRLQNPTYTRMDMYNRKLKLTHSMSTI